MVRELVKLELIILSECWGRVVNNKDEIPQRSSCIFNFGDANVLRLWIYLRVLIQPRLNTLVWLDSFY